MLSRTFSLDNPFPKLDISKYGLQYDYYALF